jgi:hypothetical protein
VSSPAGWYPQPDGQQKYWDGNQWTDHLAPGAPVVHPESLHVSAPMQGAATDSAAHTALVPRPPAYVAQQLNPMGPVGPRGMTRSPVAVWLLLPIVTLGIYTLVWHYKINRELRDFHPSIQVDPGLALLAMFIPIAYWVTIYNTGKRIAQAQQLSGMGSPCSGGLGVLGAFFFNLNSLYYQSQLNRLWRQV